MLVASLTHSITQLVNANGVYAVFLLLALDAVFPAISELVMVYGGAVASGAISGQHVVLFGSAIHSHLGGYVAIAATGTLGYLAGAWVGWAIGARAGRPFVERHARAFHLDSRKLARADAWFAHYGGFAVFLGRITPVVRSFVAIPAGFERMPLARYSLLTLAGNALWCFGLAAGGWAIGTGYGRLHQAFDDASIALVVATVVGAAAVALRAWRRPRAGARPKES